MEETTKVTNLQNTIDFALISEKQAQLAVISTELKQEFVGIDYIIDEFINYIRVWYLMPELLTRPIIISLWGMTGVGKTDLVRRLVNKLGYQERFVEIELSNSESSSYYKYETSVAAILSEQGISDKKPSIVLFDEIQRFATIDRDGEPIQNEHFQDFWELLSDGRLARREEKSSINEYWEDYFFEKKRRSKEREQTAKDDSEKREYEGVGLYHARQVKELFALEDSLFMLADLNSEELFEKLEERRKKKKIFEAVDYSKTLIIISGNLDEAFSMAREASEADVDADIFHAYTKKISLVDIKNALLKKFKPEQVARFGNIHLIYRSLRKRDFEKLIDVEIQKIIERNAQHFGIKLQISNAIKRLIYQNGVFPVQGVRPVFSSVIDVLESNLVKIIFESLLKGHKEVRVDYSFSRKKIVAKMGQTARMEINFVGRVDKIRQENRLNMVANVSVHEAGHAVAYGVLFGLAALQLQSRLASSYASGFTFPHQIYETKQTMINQIKVLLAGGIAEEVLFGDENATIGRSSDRFEASRLAGDFIRKYGFDPQYQAYWSNSPAMNMDVFQTDKSIEAMMQYLVTETRQLLETHKSFLIGLSKKLLAVGSMKAQDIAQVAAEYHLNLSVKPETYMYIKDYDIVLLEL